MRLIEGTPKEIADFVFLQQSQRQLVRAPYSNETELIPIVENKNQIYLDREEICNAISQGVLSAIRDKAEAEKD